MTLMRHVDIVNANIDHAWLLAGIIREQDVDKCAAVTGRKAGLCLVDCLQRSQRAFTAIVDGEPAAMFGVVGTVLSPVGVPWLLCSDLAFRYPVRFAMLSREYLPRLAHGYALLENYVLDENEKAQTWLQWLGFTLEDPRPYGHGGRLFRRYTYEGDQ